MEERILRKMILVECLDWTEEYTTINRHYCRISEPEAKLKTSDFQG